MVLTSQTRRYAALISHAAQSARIDATIPQYYDPRVWVREGEKTLVARVKEANADLGNTSQSPCLPARPISFGADCPFFPVKTVCNLTMISTTQRTREGVDRARVKRAMAQEA